MDKKILGSIAGVALLGAGGMALLNNEGSASNSSSTPSATYQDMDCEDFSTQQEAQEFFESEGGPQSDSHRLDRDKDGVACETLD